MAINGYFFNAVLQDGVYDRIYNAEDFSSYLDKLVGNGVFPNPSNQLQVFATDPAGMRVIVNTGSAWLNGHKMINTASLELPISQANVLLNRLDLVVFYVDYTTREMGIAVKEGTPAANPSKPELQRDANKYEMCLAIVSIPKQTTGITQALITDTRGNSTVCGYVQGLIQQVDTSTLWKQQQAQFDDWFDSVQDELQAGKQFKKLEGVHVTIRANEASWNVTTYVPSYSYIYDILEVFINGIHLNGNEYTLSNSTVTLETPISRSGQTVTFVVYKSVDPDA